MDKKYELYDSETKTITLTRAQMAVAHYAIGAFLCKIAEHPAMEKTARELHDIFNDYDK